ncbi:MAG: RagB/SusD family nutrient uptake outer membrane protein [Chitinophagaceae bacterium]|nr:RagB/SusD family nutrient uptake outer membrane protein [Chitinophagaceae bacterium]
MMRYSHVLTIYAEARTRSGSPDDLAYKCLNDARVREKS